MKNKMTTMSKMGVIFLTARRWWQREIVTQKITLKQYYLLRRLKKVAFLNPSQVAEMLFCDRPTATVIIKNLERQGWIRREKDPENGKQIRLFITEDGFAKCREVESFLSQQEDYDPLDCLTAKEREQLDEIITKVYRNLK